MSAQIPLAFKPNAEHRFADFVGQEDIRHVFEQAAEGSISHSIFLAGASGSGKSHLLHACANFARAQGVSAAYVPVVRVLSQLEQIIEGFEQHELVCFDDVDRIKGSAQLQEALFHFYNRATAAGTRIIFSADKMPAQLQFTLPDLVSRLEQGLRLQLEMPSDAQKLQIILNQAKMRGLQLDESVTDYLFTRVSRDLHTLSHLIERLDRESLAAQRRITVPFLKTVLAD